MWNWFKRKKTALGNDVVAATLPEKEGRPLADEIRRDAASVFAAWPLSASGQRLTDDQCAQRFFFYRKTPFSLNDLASDPFACYGGEAPDARVHFDVSLAITAPDKLLSQCEARADEKDDGGGRWFDLDSVALEIALALPETLRDYSFDQLKALQPQHVCSLLSSTLSGMGLEVLSVSRYRVSSESAARREEQEHQRRRLEELTREACDKERLKFMLEEQLAEQQRRVEIAVADHRIELARRAQRHELNRLEFEVECERLEQSKEAARLAVEKARQELAEATARAETADRLKAELPGLLERTTLAPFQELLCSFRNQVGEALPLVSRTLSEFVEGVGAINRAAGGLGAEMETLRRGLAALGEDARVTREEIERIRQQARLTAEAFQSGPEAVRTLMNNISLGAQKWDEINRMADRLRSLLSQFDGAPLSRLFALLNNDGHATGWSPAAIEFGAALAEKSGRFSSEDARELAARAALLETFRRKIRREFETGRRVPALTLELLNRSARPIGSDNVACGTRGMVHARSAVRLADRFRIRVVPPRRGYLCLVSQGRNAAERPRILYPFLNELMTGRYEGLAVEERQLLQYPDILGVSTGLQLTEEPEAPAHSREILFALVTAFPPQFIHIPPRHGDLPAWGVAAEGGEQSVPIGLDAAAFFIDDDGWTCGMLEFEVEADRRGSVSG